MVMLQYADMRKTSKNIKKHRKASKKSCKIEIVDGFFVSKSRPYFLPLECCANLWSCTRTYAFLRGDASKKSDNGSMLSGHLVQIAA